jgi:glycosyltransferase involved in cell wall biosynthesis
MRIVHVTYEYPGVTENCGGGGRVVETLHEALCARGHDSQVVAQQAPHHAVWPFWSLRDVIETIQAHDPDVIHGHFAVPSSLLLPLLAARFDVPLVVTCMGADVYDPTRYQTIRPLLDSAVGRVLRAADAIVAPSGDMVGRVREKYGVPALLVPHGIRCDDWDWRPGQPRGPLHVLTVARHVARKNLDTACKATADLSHRGEPVYHRLVGTGPRREALQARYGHTNVHEFAGYVKNLQPEYDAADIFLLPSEHEAFGLVFCEALACGLPVVTSDHGGQGEIVRDGVGEVRSHDAPPAVWADALQTVAADYDNYCEATRGYIEQEYSAAQMTDRYLALYKTFTSNESDTTRRLRKQRAH